GHGQILERAALVELGREQLEEVLFLLARGADEIGAAVASERLVELRHHGREQGFGLALAGHAQEAAQEAQVEAVPGGKARAHRRARADQHAQPALLVARVQLPYLLRARIVGHARIIHVWMTSASCAHSAITTARSL